MKARNHTQNGNKGQGSNWIRREKRLRIYARDGWRCVWCRRDVIDGASIQKGYEYNPNGVRAVRAASLDHFLGRHAGGCNGAGNLLTSCMQCNDERGELSALEYASKLARAKALAAGATLDREALYRHEILERVLKALERELPPKQRDNALELAA
jgi:hypothetical protein